MWNLIWIQCLIVNINKYKWVTHYIMLCILKCWLYHMLSLHCFELSQWLIFGIGYRGQVGKQEYKTHILYPSRSSLQVSMCFRKILFLENTRWKYSNCDESWWKPILRFSLRANSLVRRSFGKQVGCFLAVYFWAQSKTSTNYCFIGAGICLNQSTERVGILSSPMYYGCEFLCFWIRQ